MLEYGETYLSENTQILEDMYERMSDEAVALAKYMAEEADAAELEAA